jgi:hypothetical protein
MLEIGIAQLVLGSSAKALAVQAIIGTRFYPVTLPEDPLYPCASYQLISDVPDYLLKGQQGIEVKRIQVDTWSGGATNASYLDAKNAQGALRALLEGYVGLLSDGTRIAGVFVHDAVDLFEQDARAYRTRTDYLIHFYPAS